MPFIFKNRFNTNYQFHYKFSKDRYIILSFEAFGDDFTKVPAKGLMKATNLLTVWEFRKVKPLAYQEIDSDEFSEEKQSIFFCLKYQ